MGITENRRYLSSLKQGLLELDLSALDGKCVLVA